MIIDTDFLLFISAILFIAALIHGSIGFGFPMIATPLLAMYTDIQMAIIYTLVPTLIVNLVSIISEGAVWEALKKFYPLVLFAMLGSAIGTQILIVTNAEIFKLLLAAAILGYLMLDFIKLNIPWIRNCPTCSMRAFGLGSGLLGGLTNAMAPVLIIYSLESKMSKKESIQAANLCFLVGKIIQIILFTLASSISISMVEETWMALIAVAFALFIGLKIKSKIDAVVYKRIVKLILFIIAMVLIVKYFV